MTRYAVMTLVWVLSIFLMAFAWGKEIDWRLFASAWFVGASTTACVWMIFADADMTTRGWRIAAMLAPTQRGTFNSNPELVQHFKEVVPIARLRDYMLTHEITKLQQGRGNTYRSENDEPGAG